MLHTLDDAEFVDEMSRRFDGIPPAVRANGELLKLLLPAMRADMELLETYEYEEQPPLDVDILALGGTEDRGGVGNGTLRVASSHVAAVFESLVARRTLFSVPVRGPA